MVEQIKVRARWGARSETADMCALRALRSLDQLRRCDQVFPECWFECGTSLGAALAHRIELNLESLRRTLERGRSRLDDHEALTPELGFWVGLWNGLAEEEGPTRVSIHCGAHPSPTVLPGPNEVSVALPYKGLPAQRLVREDKLRQITAAIVDHWDPDWACVTTYQVYEAIYGPEPYSGQVVGWLTYVSERYGALPRMPAGCRTERLGAGGSLITVTSIKRLTVGDLDHVSIIRSASDALFAAGMLAPVPQVSA